MNRPTPLLLVLSTIAGLLACSSDGTATTPSREDTSPVVAEVSGQTITLDALDSWIKDDFFDREVSSQGKAQAYAFRREALDRMMRELAVSAVAEQEGVSAEALIDATVAEMGPVTDEEVRAYYEENKSRIPASQTYEKLAPQIRDFLVESRPRMAVEQITAQADTTVFLETPRTAMTSEGPSIGPASAPVTIVEFSDFQCPYCSRAAPRVKEIMDLYPEQVRFVYRHLPLGFHDQARPAAIASECADQQGHFWEFHDQLFVQQRALSPVTYRRIADEIGLDGEAFDACLTSPAANARVDADTEAARAAGVSGTPAFFINGILLSGARPLEDFVQVIDAELERLN